MIHFGKTSLLMILFLCALDDAAFETCRSPHTVRNLMAGQHQFKIRAVDTTLNRDPTPASRVWTVTPDGAELPQKMYLPLLIRNAD